MYFAYGHWCFIPYPGLPKNYAMPLDSFRGSPDSLGVGITVPIIAAPVTIRIKMKAFIEHTVTGEVIIDPDYIECTIGTEQEIQLRFCRSVIQQPTVKRMVPVYPTCKKIQTEPASLVFKIRLIRE